jgi:hypothetical protein
MAQYSSANTILIIDGYNVLGVNTELSINSEALTQEVTAFGDTWEAHRYIELKKADISQNGYYDDAALAINEALSGKQGETRIACFGFEGNTIGKTFTGIEGAMQIKYDRLASKGTIHRVNASYSSNGEVEDGKIIHALAARTTAGNTQATPVNNGAQTTGGAVVYLQLTNLTLGGYTNIVVKVRQSADGITWEDLDTFTAVTAAPGKERKIKTGTIKQYLAVSWAYTGSGSNQSATFLVGVARK